MEKIIVSISCLIIFFNSVPRINDMHSFTGQKLCAWWVRLAGLLVTAGSSMWLGIAVLIPNYPHDSAATLMMAGVAAAWTSSPVVGNWWGFAFKDGSNDRYKALNRRSTDKEYMK